CYAKTIDLSAEKEPEIFGAIRFGSVLENVVFDEDTRVVDYSDKSLTENTRCAYPIEYIPNALIPCVGNMPKNIVMLTCDALGVLPPVSKLTSSQAIWLYATMLAAKIEEHKVDVWLINTGWNGGAYGTGKRIALKYSRAIIDAIHNGELKSAEYETYPIFGLEIPKAVTGVPAEVLNPATAWQGTPETFNATVSKLAGLFNENFAKYADQATEDVIAVGPKI
ncbi:Protein kinase C-like 1, partial [Linnemannia elongata]